MKYLSSKYKASSYHDPAILFGLAGRMQITFATDMLAMVKRVN